MELRNLLGVLNRRKWIILATTVLTLAVVAAGISRITPIYVTIAVARVAGGYSGTVNFADLNYGERLRETYVFLLKSRPFLDQVATRLGSGLSVEDIAAATKVESLPNTELIRVTVEHRDPAMAAAIANTLTGLLVEQGQKLYAGEGKSALEILQEQLRDLEDRLKSDRALLVTLTSTQAGSPTPGATSTPSKTGSAASQDDSAAPKDGSTDDLAARIKVQEQTFSTLLSQYERARTDEALRANSISIAEPAIAPLVPSKPNRRMYLVLAGLVGLVGGIGLAMVFENLDPAIHSTDDLRALVTVPLLGRIPRFRVRWYGRRGGLLSGAGKTQAAAFEAFRALSINTLAADPAKGLRSLLVSSAEPGAGKSVVVANLAVAVARTGRRVIVVDADLRHPCQHHLFGVPLGWGLTDALLDPLTVDYALQTTLAPNVRLLVAGSQDGNPAERFTAQSLTMVLQSVTAQADFVLLDSPPILASADAAILAPLVDGVLIVAARDRTSSKQLDLALAALSHVGARPLGLVYNLADDDGAGDRYYRESSPGRSGVAPSNGREPEASTVADWQPAMPDLRREA